MIYWLNFYMDGFTEVRMAALEGQEMVGVANLRLNGHGVATIYQLFVVAEHRKTGIGTSLVAAASKIVGVQTLSAITKDRTVDEFYRKLGFELVHIEGDQFLWSKKV